MPDNVPKSATRGHSIRKYLGLVLGLLLAVAFLAAGIPKLAGNPMMVQEFAKVGLGQWFRYFTGILEVSGAIGVLFPRVRTWAALLLSVVMAGAITAHLTVLASSPALPAVLLVIALTTAWLAEPQRI
jgi:putative oxidoreductase